MNKKLSMLIVVFILCFSQVFAVECGDVNSDDEVNIVDALLVAQFYVGLNPTSFDESAADVNGDSNINIIDALLMARYYVGLINILEGCNIQQTPAPTSGITPAPGTGIIKITDHTPGWASMAGGTTGGGTDLSKAITVTSMSDLQNHAAGTDSKIIFVEPGTYIGPLQLGANKTIIGTEPGVLIKGYVHMRGDTADISGNKESYNVIIRNIAVQGDHCSTLTECKTGPDAVYMGWGAHHLWLDHMDIYDGQDGNCDATRAGDYMTVSWSQFRYTYDKEHRFSNLIGGSDNNIESRGKLNITYMKCWWGERVIQRQPRGRFGDVHCFNNYHSSKSNEDGKLYALGPGFEMALIVENCVFDMTPDAKAIKLGDEPVWRGVLATGNIGQSKEGYPMNCDVGTVFIVPYPYDLIDATKVKDAVTAQVGGAGNTCVFEQ